ncbi:prenyltransferase/squalene oxidase repeat-containing protein [Aeoliella mucimassa]|uniref:Prenyltransferase and squalene oxidase repeat protein n=1 Tax=Aeoliella mucimassa TaxID=2527972 RepID=A0A518AL76_9BACT|nr:prenyltransferase/squalene oxidase repeat-containing protein [Aeoliella mucimassa]QDU55477.1 Prenyltransferase and squalene oxidase repeat protein [Aeoliella mucimassa]
MFSTTVTAVAPAGSLLRKSPVLATPSSCPTDDWLREWNSPVVATAAAVGALVQSEQHGHELPETETDDEFDSAYQTDLSEVIVSSVHWLARHQQKDGGYSGIATDCSAPSNLLTTIMVRSAFQLTGAPAAYPDLVDRINQYIKRNNGLDQLRVTYGPFHNATLLARGISALTEVLDCQYLPTIPVETFPLDGNATRPVFWADRGSITPALIALGLASYHNCKPLNPLTLWRRSRAYQQVHDWLRSQQQKDGGFGDSVAVTSLVILSLASIGQTSGPIVRRGVEYLFSTLSSDGSWPPHPAAGK